jgi:hypothetical protein
MTKTDWLRSEIEKLEGMMLSMSMEIDTYSIHVGDIEDVKSYNLALTSIITRYKEELLELEKGV